MKAKDKKEKYKKISLKKIIIFLVSIIILLYLLVIYDYYLKKDEVYASENSPTTNTVKISNAGQIDVEEMISKNTNEMQRDEYITEENDLEYITKYKNNENLPKGVIQVIQQGREGKQEITTRRTIKNGEIISENQVNSKITKASVDKIVEVGTGNQTNSYKVKVGDNVLITADRVSVMTEPNENSSKVATLIKGNELKVLEIQNEWYKITGQETTGYIKAENTMCENANTKAEEKQENNANNKKTENKVQQLSFDIELNKPSGLSLEQFKKVLTDSKDKNKVFQNNAEYFYYIEEQYNINGLFVAAVGIHESNWGTSKIAQQKHNLFGYGAYDSNPYNGAYQFSNYSESIDLISRVFVKYYINPKGTSIYGGESASGKYYNGATLSGINQRYATDKNWANGVYKNMQYLYNKL